MKGNLYKEELKNKSFGELLASLGEEQGWNAAAQIAEQLYENDICYNLLQPGGREYKYKFNERKDKNAISRRVQEHLAKVERPDGTFSYKEAFEIPGEYMLAYSIIFNCSLDYLYGRIAVAAPNAEVADISEKTGLSSSVVDKLMNSEDVCMEEYLAKANDYGLLETYNPDIDPDEVTEEDEYIDTYASKSKFWNEVLESDMFDKIPEAWYRMACALYTSKGIKMVAEYAKSDWNTLPSFETFMSWVHTWEYFHPKDELFIPSYQLEDLYKEDPDHAMQVYREIRYDHFYKSVEDESQYEDIYLGCAGKFERELLQYFHERAEQWCNEGPLPSFNNEK